MRIVIIDDHPTVREGLKRVLERDATIRIVGEASTAEEGLALVEGLACDVVLMDLSLPDRSGVWCIQEMRKRRPDLPIVVLSMHTEDSYVVEALQAGASGYVVKSAPPDDVLTALREVARGGSYVHAKVVGAVLHRLQKPPMDDDIAPSLREKQVLRLVVAGESNLAIGQHLNVSLSTVKSVMRSLFNKFNVADRTQLVVRLMDMPALRRQLDTMESQESAR